MRQLVTNEPANMRNLKTRRSGLRRGKGSKAHLTYPTPTPDRLRCSNVSSSNTGRHRFGHRGFSTTKVIESNQFIAIENHEEVALRIFGEHSMKTQSGHDVDIGQAPVQDGFSRPTAGEKTNRHQGCRSGTDDSRERRQVVGNVGPMVCFQKSSEDELA